MGNTTNVVQAALDAGEDLATFLARTYGDSNVAAAIQTLKVDSSGPGLVSHIANGQVNQALLNLIDDAIIAYYPQVAAVAAGAGNWQSVYSVDLTAEGTQTVDGSDNLTVGGNTWYGWDFDASGGRVDKNQITNGVGLELDTKSGSGDAIFELLGSPSADDVPAFEISLSDLYAFRWTDKVRVAVDVDVEFDDAGGFSYAGLGFRTVDVTTPGKGTQTTHHAHVSRRNNSSNSLESVFRANANETGGGIVAARSGIDTLTGCSFMMESEQGVYTGYVGGPYSSGWPAWNIVSSGRPSFDTGTDLNLAEFNNQSTGPFDLRTLMTVYRNGTTSDNARMNVKRLEVFVKREDLP